MKRTCFKRDGWFARAERIITKKKKHKPFYTDMEKDFFGIILALCFVILGILCNFTVVVNNNGLMPVHTSYDLNSDKHFSFQNQTEVSHYLLADIIGSDNFLGIYFYFSIGDVLMYLGYAIAIGYSLILIKDERKRKLERILLS